MLGVHLVGARVGDLIAEAQLIYNWDAYPADVAQLIHPHPTQSEAIGEAHLALAGNGRSQILQTSGAAKVIAAEDGGPVLGIHLVGARVGELIAEGQLIYNWEALPSEVAQLIHPHPTQSEIIGEAHLALAGKPLHFHS